ncbi:MAG: DoxX family protein [Proteobacteria bacterium]|nr:DoxX family protein [Pseudomonadota bacterium]
MQLYIPALAPAYAKVQDCGYPLVRIITGLALIPHGAQKLFEIFGGNRAATAGLFSKIGLEPAMALTYLVGTVEFFGGILIMIGLLTRPAAALVVVIMAVAVFKVHIGNGFFWTKLGFEYPMFWGVVALALVFGGSGKMSVDAKLGKEF